MPRLNLPLMAVLLLAALPAWALWPTTVRENLPIAATPEVYESDPSALPLDNGRTLVLLFSAHYFSNCYQILNRFGEAEFSELQELAPDVTDIHTGHCLVIADGSGGAFAAWYIAMGPREGFYAQRLDSQGNRLWGDAGIHIFNFQPAYTFGISTDGVGDLLVAVTGNETVVQVAVQKVSPSGQLLWGESGVVVCNLPYGQQQAVITHDGNGGAYVTWNDYRPPTYGNPYGNLFMQRLDAEGNPLWQPNGVFFFEDPWIHQMIPDGQGGFILHCGHGAENWVYRIGPSGNSLWMQYRVSWTALAKMVEGEPGYFYLGFCYLMGVYGQRMDMQGNIYWPTWGSGQPGALMAMMDPGWTHNAHEDWAYQYPYFFGVYDFRAPNWYPINLLAQSLDSLGNRRWGVDGTLLASIPSGPNLDFYQVVSCGDGIGGTVAVFATWAEANVYAKHVNSNGSLGDPQWPPPVYYNPGELFLGITGESVHYSLPAPGDVEITLYDLLGRRVAGLQQGYQPAGCYVVRIGAQNLAAGIYVVRLESRFWVEARKVVVLR